MTNPGPMPADTLGGYGGIAAWAESDANAWKNSLGQGVVNSGAGISLFGTSTKQTAAQQLEIINDHTAQLSEIRETVESQILQGLAVPFESSGWWYPPRNLVYAELIGVGAGGGGSAGIWNAVTTGRRGGRGGGGGGETHLDGITRIYAAFLPKTGDDYSPIRVDMYLAGNGGSGSGNPGTAGGNIIFGANLSTPIVTFFGGNGALAGDSVDEASGRGGGGMIVGGRGGAGAGTPETDGGAAFQGANSASSHSFAGGGGGGGGGGSWYGPGAAGGNGVSTSGGLAGSPGVATNRIIAAGGSGGGGARNGGEPGGAGGFPGGGGGGGFGGSLSEGASAGGPGAQAKFWIVETKNSEAA